MKHTQHTTWENDMGGTLNWPTCPGHLWGNVASSFLFSGLRVPGTCSDSVTGPWEVKYYMGCPVWNFHQPPMVVGPSTWTLRSYTSVYSGTVGQVPRPRGPPQGAKELKRQTREIGTGLQNLHSYVHTVWWCAGPCRFEGSTCTAHSGFGSLGWLWESVVCRRLQV